MGVGGTGTYDDVKDTYQKSFLTDWPYELDSSSKANTGGCYNQNKDSTDQRI